MLWSVSSLRDLKTSDLRCELRNSYYELCILEKHTFNKFSKCSQCTIHWAYGCIFKQATSHFFLLKLQYLNFNAGHHKQVSLWLHLFRICIPSNSTSFLFPTFLTSFFPFFTVSFVFFPYFPHFLLFSPSPVFFSISLSWKNFKVERIPSSPLYSQPPEQFLSYGSYEKEDSLNEHINEVSRTDIVLILSTMRQSGWI